MTDVQLAPASLCTGKKIGYGRNKKPMSKSKRAGLVLPVGRVSRLLRRGRFAPRIGGGAAIYLTAVLEYLSAEVLELSGNAARENKCRRITPRHMQLAVRNDSALDNLFQETDWMQSGVVPHIETALLPKPKKSRIISFGVDKQAAGNVAVLHTVF